jgi:hypothetical protein
MMKKLDTELISGNTSTRGRRWSVSIGLLVFLLAQPLLAVDTDLELEAGVGYSNNISRVDAGSDIDEVITTAGITLKLEEKSRRLDLNVKSNLSFISYEDNTFDEETLGFVTADALIRLSEQNFSWFITENYGQQIIDPLRPVTPDNRENINYFTTGPRLSLPLGARTHLNLNGSFSDVQYEEQPFDNQRFGGSIGIERELSPNRSLSLIVDADRIEYDDAPPNAPVDRQSAYLRLQTSVARNQLSLNLGWNRVERSANEGDGLLAELDWSRQISAQSTFSLHAGTKFSDAGDIFRFIQSIDSRRGDTQDVQNINDPFRLDTASVRYVLDEARSRFSVYAFYENENYESRTDLDRDRSGINLDLARDLTRNLNAALFATLSNRDYANTTRSDDDSTFGFRLRWGISRTIGLSFRVQRIKRDSNDNLLDYEEGQAYLTLLFKTGKR